MARVSVDNKAGLSTIEAVLVQVSVGRPPRVKAVDEQNGREAKNSSWARARADCTSYSLRSKVERPTHLIGEPNVRLGKA